MTQKFLIRRRTPTARRQQQQQQRREGGRGGGRRSARAFVFVVFFLLACECSSIFPRAEAQSNDDDYTISTGGYETTEGERSFAVKSYLNGTVAVVSPKEILIDASVVRVPSDVHVAALEDDALDLTGHIGYDLDTVESKLTQLRETVTNVKLLAAKNVAGNVQCNLEGTKEVRFDFESKSFDTTHCVCKDKFVGDLCETLIGGLSGDREQFVAAVTKCLEVDPVHGNCPDSEYGVMSEWDVSLVKDFSYAFSGQTTFNADISAWDTRSAESFEGTFNECGAFNQDLSKWNTASVTSMHRMFAKASAFDSDLSSWDTSKIKNMSFAFLMAHSFKGIGLSGWDTSEVLTLEGTFKEATVFDENIWNWTTTKVTSMLKTFSASEDSTVAFNQPIGTWDTSSVTTMKGMFYSNSNFNQPLQWDTRLVVNMKKMFSGASAFNSELSINEALGYWVTSSVENFQSMFEESSFNQDISGWDTSAATDMSYMFYNLKNFNQDLSEWIVSKVTTFRATFYNCQTFDASLSKWDVSSVKTFEQTFQRAYVFDSDLSQWNTAAVTNMNSMFHTAKAFNHPIGSWDVSKVSNMRYMFYAATAYKQDLRGWNLATISTTNIVSGIQSYYDLYLIFSGATKMSAYWKCDETAGLKTADVSSCSPQLLLPKTDYHAKLQECQKTCKAQNHCCNLDVSVGSNQYNSCLQSCAGRLSGQTQATCEAGCVKSCNGGLTVEGETFSKCSTCSDLGGNTTTSGTCSAQYGSNEETCKAGCAIAPDLGKYWRIRLLEQEGAWNVKELQFFTGQGNTGYYNPKQTTKTSAWAGGSLHDKTKCIQSSNYPGHYCDRAFDNDVTNSWSNWASSYPSTESSPWIGMSFDEAVTVSHVRFLNGRGWPEGKTAVIEHAMDLKGEWTEWSGSRIITEAKIQDDSAGENTWQEAVAIENFKYVGEGECRQEDGEYGISFETSLYNFAPHTEGSNAANAFTDCAAKCKSFSWCLSFNLILRDIWSTPYCDLITDWQAYVVQAGQTFQKNEWGGSQTLDGVDYQTYCNGGNPSDKCTEANVHGNGSLYPREGYHCYARTGFSS